MTMMVMVVVVVMMMRRRRRRKKKKGREGPVMIRESPPFPPRTDL